MVTEQDKLEYMSLIIEEMQERGYAESEIATILNKSKFKEKLSLYPKQQMHVAPSNAVDDIIFSAALAI